MTNRPQYTPSPAAADQFCGMWDAHVDALERHLSINRWAMAAVSVVLIAYPIARILIPAALHAIVPDVVRRVINFI